MLCSQPVDFFNTWQIQMKNHLLNLLKIVIGVSLLAFLYNRLEDPAALWAQVMDSNKLMLLLGATAFSCAVALNGVKWGILLRAQALNVPFRRLIAFQWMAIFLDNFFPAQVGGDVLRGYNLARDTHRTADAAASVLIDRFTGLTAFMLAAAMASSSLLLWGPTTVAPQAGEDMFLRQFIDVRLIAVGSLIGALTMITIMALMLSRRLKRWAEAIIARLPLIKRLLPFWQKLAAAINAYRYKYVAMIAAGMVSLVIVVLTSVNIWLISNAIAPGSISFVEVLVINPIIAFLVLVPLSPGGLGVRQFGFSALFVMMGASGALGFAVGLLQQFINYVVSIPGLILWIRGNRADAREAEAVAEHPAPLPH